MATPVLNWNRMSVPEKLLKVQFIVGQMTENVTDFPTPFPALADVTAANDDLAKKAVAAQAGGYALTFAKNEAEKSLHELMKQLMAYVQNISGSNEALIIKSGFDIKRPSAPLPAPLQVENLSALPSRTQGEILLKWDTLKNVIGYQVELWMEADEGTGFWDELAVTTRSKFTVTGLETGTVYRFRVAGLGKNDVYGPYSQDARSVAP
jgi:hypothetical protein